MPNDIKSKLPFLPSLPFSLFIAFMCVLFAAGGSSRPDAAGQVIVQATAVLAIIFVLLKGSPTSIGDAKPVWLILTAAIALAAVQLLPLPPSVWQALPGRAPLSQAAIIIGQPQPWRPISLVPGATVNALASLIVPVTTLLLITRFKSTEWDWLPGSLLSLISATMLIGLVQFSGLNVITTLSDNAAGIMSGFLANRNHFGLVMAIGCTMAPAWALSHGRRQAWRGPLSLGLVLLFVLSILASGSRAGLIIGTLGFAAGLVIARAEAGRLLAMYPRWVFPAAITTVLACVAGFALASFAAGRAISVNRILAMDPSQDMRTRALPHIIDMVKTYFPVGSGLGSFDPVYRINEPLELLTATYLNHAHNDILEVVLDGGLAGALIMLGAVLWWARSSVRVWKTAGGKRNTLPKVGSAIILLTMVASITDYPSRTPVVMAILVVAATWLARAANESDAPLPRPRRLV